MTARHREIRVRYCYEKHMWVTEFKQFYRGEPYYTWDGFNSWRTAMDFADGIVRTLRVGSAP